MIPVSGPSITELEIEYVNDAVKNAWYENHSVYNNRFEAAFAELHGVKHAVSLPHCTAGLHLALAALQVKSGDEVIVPDVTWIASAAPISYVGATPVFAEIDPLTWCIDPESFRSLITPRTRAVIPVDLYGSMADYTAIAAIAEEHGIAVIEDAAEAVGSQLDGRRAGSHGSAGVFSFHGSKTLTTGEGGMLVTDDSDLYQSIMMLRDHGRAPGDRFFQNEKVAFKYKMSALQAALGLAQLERLDEIVAHKRQVFNWYQDGFGDESLVVLNAEPEGVLNSYWMVTAIISEDAGLDKFELQSKLYDAGVDSRPFFSPLSSLNAYKDSPDTPRAKAENKVGYSISQRGINLPSGMNMTRELVEQVVTAFKDILHKS